MQNPINKFIKLFFLIALSFASFNGFAEKAKEFDNYVVHYNAFRSDTISPEVAKQYGLPRASNRVLLNITVLKKLINTGGKPTSAEVRGHAINLTGQLKELKFREIREGSAIYYLAETKISNGESLKFDLKVKPENSNRTLHLTFEKRFYTH